MQVGVGVDEDGRHQDQLVLDPVEGGDGVGKAIAVEGLPTVVLWADARVDVFHGIENALSTVACLVIVP